MTCPSGISKSKEDLALSATLQSKFSDVLKHYENYNYREAVKVILEISSADFHVHLFDESLQLRVECKGHENIKNSSNW